MSDKEEEGRATKRQKLGPAKEEEEEEEEALSIDSLSDEVLQMILFATGWPYIHVREVCTRWKTAIDSKLRCTQCGELKRTVCLSCEKKGCWCSMRRCMRRFYTGAQAKRCLVIQCLECTEESQKPGHEKSAGDLMCCDVCHTAWMCFQDSGNCPCNRYKKRLLCANCVWPCQECGCDLCFDCAKHVITCHCCSRVLCGECEFRLNIVECPGGCGTRNCTNCCNSTCQHCDRLTCSTVNCMTPCPYCGQDWCRECEEDINCVYHHAIQL